VAGQARRPSTLRRAAGHIRAGSTRLLVEETDVMRVRAQTQRKGRIHQTEMLRGNGIDIRLMSTSPIVVFDRVLSKVVLIVVVTCALA
jgi:hypothetical protein